MFHPKFQAKSNNNNSYENIRVNCDGLSLIAVVAWTKLHFSYKVYTYDVFSTRDIGGPSQEPSSIYIIQDHNNHSNNTQKSMHQIDFCS